MRMSKLAAVVGLAVATGLGCYTQKQVKSGFLGEKYELMKPVEGNKKHRFYSNPAVDVRNYHSVIVEPVVARMAPDAPGAGIDPEDLKQMTDFMHAEIVEQLSQYYKIVDQPGPGVARLRAAITGLTPAEPALNVLPQTKLTGIGLGGAAYEGEAVDSVTGELIQCSMNASKESFSDISGGLQVWGNARHLIQEWVRDGVIQAHEAQMAAMKQ